jgi:hypothetical protein
MMNVDIPKSTVRAQMLINIQHDENILNSGAGLQLLNIVAHKVYMGRR